MDREPIVPTRILHYINSHDQLHTALPSSSTGALPGKSDGLHGNHRPSDNPWPQHKELTQFLKPLLRTARKIKEKLYNTVRYFVCLCMAVT